MRRFTNFLIGLLVAIGFVVTGCAKTSTAVGGPSTPITPPSQPQSFQNWATAATPHIRLMRVLSSPMTSDSTPADSGVHAGLYDGTVVDASGHLRCPSGYDCLVLVAYTSTDTVADGYVPDSVKQSLPGTSQRYLIGNGDGTLQTFGYVYGTNTPGVVQHTIFRFTVLDTAATSYCAQAASAGAQDVTNYCFTHCPSPNAVEDTSVCYASSTSFVVAAANDASITSVTQ